MKAKLLIATSFFWIVSGCCIAPIQGNVDFGSGSCAGDDGCQQYAEAQSSCATCGTSSYPNTHSYCGDNCTSRSCSTYFGNVGGTDPFAPGSS